MVKYLSKFLLEVLPSLVATIVGAYIVAHYINPRPETPKAAVVATAPAGEVKDAADATGTVEDKAGRKSSDAKSAEAKAKDEAKAKPAKIEEKKSAAELARAAIERLRGTTIDTPAPATPASQPVRSVPTETARADDSARVTIQTAPQRAQAATPAPAAVASVPAPQPATVAVTAPPLPPPVIVASPYGRHPVGQEEPMTINSAERPTDQANADRPTPPADIPGQRDGFDLQAQATPVEHVSIADHVLSTTKSFFRALTPNSQPSNFSQSN
jgi:hypothetical protein